MTGPLEATPSTSTKRASAPFARTASKHRQQQQLHPKSHGIKALLQQGSNKGGGAAAPASALSAGVMLQKPLRQPLPLEARELDEEEQLQRTLEVCLCRYLHAALLYKQCQVCFLPSPNVLPVATKRDTSRNKHE